MTETAGSVSCCLVVYCVCVRVPLLPAEPALRRLRALLLLASALAMFCLCGCQCIDVFFWYCCCGWLVFPCRPLLEHAYVLVCVDVFYCVFVL